MEVSISWKGAVQFEAQSGTGHTLKMDGAPEAGGQDAGPRPMELMLMGTAGCSSFDVLYILKKMQQQVSSCECKATAERAEEPPRVFTKIHLHFEVEGTDLLDNKVARAVHLSAEKYCSASIMLGRGGVEVTHSYEILESAGSPE